MQNSLSIVLIGTNNYEMSNFSIENTIKNIEFDEIITFSDKVIHDKATLIKINKIKSIKDYSYFCLKCLNPFIRTSHVLIIQYDGFAANKSYWNNNFFDYDYIGAPWIGQRWDKVEENLCVGNGGFSLRSKKLLEALTSNKINLNDHITLGVNEDYIICSEYRKFLEDNSNIRFAPKNIASNFSNECQTRNSSFGFHGLWNIPLYLKEDVCLDLLDKIDISYLKKNSSYIDMVNNCKISNYKDLFFKIKDKLDFHSTIDQHF